MEKRYNFRLYPNKAQEEQIQRNFGCVRFVYNHYLAKRIEAHENGQGIIGPNECCRDLTALKKTDGHTWLKEADDNSLRQAIKTLDLAFKSFFRNAGKENTAPGFPRFKSKKDKSKSYWSKNNYSRTSIIVADKAIKLPKLGFVDCSVSRPLEGRVLSATVFQVPSGKYFVSICCTDFEPEPLPKTGAAVGIHMGINSLAVTSDGQLFENHRFHKQSMKKIALLHREMSRKPSDSNNREKARLRLARAYERLCNKKTDALQKMTTQIVRDYDVICIRDENLRDMMKDRRFAGLLSDAGWGEFARLLSYKSKWYGKTLIKLDPLHPSSQICSACGHLNEDMRKKKHLAQWDCSKCGAHHDRSVNTAANILIEATSDK